MVASLISGSGLSLLTESEAPVPTQIRHRVLDLARSGGGSVDSLAHSNRTIDQLPQRVAVDVIEAPDVQAALSALVRTQPRQHRLMPALELADQVDDQMLAARCETCQRRIALVAAGVPVVIAAETDDAGSPHGRRFTGDLPHHGAQ